MSALTNEDQLNLMRRGGCQNCARLEERVVVLTESLIAARGCLEHVTYNLRYPVNFSETIQKMNAAIASTGVNE